ncbi:MAG TPA: hypothetical protein VK587_10915 [bacterium]|nr:hypothetical protein [bacterium]
MLRSLGVVLLTIGTALGPFAAGSRAAVDSSATLRTLNDVSTNLAQLERLHATMTAIDSKQLAAFRTLNGRIASVAKLAATPGVSQSVLMQQISSLADLSTQDQLVLQEAMQQKDQFEETFSHLLKATQATTNSVIGNMKK